jgi:hypothetical protein
MEDPWWQVWEWAIFYWARDPEWWIGASQGAVGALIGFGGLVVAYRLTRKGERTKRLEEQSLEGVARVMEASLALEHKQPYEIGIQDIQNLQRELMLLHVRLIQTHPETARWAQMQSIVLNMRSNNQFGTAAAREYSVKIATDLTLWLMEDRLEGMLDADHCLAEWGEVHDHFSALAEKAGPTPPEPSSE